MTKLVAFAKLHYRKGVFGGEYLIYPVVPKYRSVDDFARRYLELLLDGVPVGRTLAAFNVVAVAGVAHDQLRTVAVWSAMPAAVNAVVDHARDDNADFYGAAILAEACNVPSGDFAPAS